MILLVTPIQRAQECAARIRQLTGEPVAIAKNLSAALPHLRACALTAVIFDQHLVEAEPLEHSTALAHAGDAACLEINFVLTGVDRMVHEVKAALERREHSLGSARTAAALSLHRNLNSTLTRLLLNCSLASETPNLAPATLEKLTSIRDAAEKLREDLEIKAAMHA